MTLSDLKLNESAHIVGFSTDSPACRQKLFACGLVPGAEVCVIRIAPLGDPLQICVDGNLMLSIRKSEGQNVTVRT